MRKHTLSVLVATFVLGLIMGPAAQPAKAIKQFRDEFVAKYVKPDSQDPKDKAFSEAVDEAKCNLCHMGASKKDRNVYGTALAELLDRKTDKDNKEKIAEALDKVAKMQSNPDDPGSPTFGDLISEGKLPCPLEN